MSKTKFDPSTLNGTYHLKGTDFVIIQWYPGVGTYYSAWYLDNARIPIQRSMTVKQAKRLVKEFGKEQST